jgi:hypothetical protein
MYIEAVPNRNSPPVILRRESFRHEGKVRKRTLCALSDWSPAHVEGLRAVLKGGTVIPPEHDAFTATRSLPHGHVAAALGTARNSASIASSALRGVGKLDQRGSAGARARRNPAQLRRRAAADL